MLLARLLTRPIIGTNYISTDYKTNIIQEYLNNRDYFDGGSAAKDNSMKNRVMICIDGPSACAMHDLVTLNINIMNISKRPLKKLILGLGSGNALDGLGKGNMEYIVKVYSRRNLLTFLVTYFLIRYKGEHDTPERGACGRVN